MNPLPTRTIRLLAGGAFLVLVAFVFLDPLLERLLLPPTRTDVRLQTYLFEAPEGLAPVLLWGERPPGENYWRTKRAARLLVVKGEAFIDRQHIPHADLAAYLDERVARGEIDHVMITSAVNSRWGELIPTIDACRRSRVRTVLLNYFEW
jgi:hypothetical protein